MKSLQNQTAVITGASSGIGRAIAHSLAEQGSHVVLAARRAERLQELADEITSQYQVEAKVVETDVTSAKMSKIS